MGSDGKHVWFVTGAARGFGLEITREALRRGHVVVAGARDGEAVEAAIGLNERLLPVQLDVTDETQAAAAVDQTLARFGRIDVVVNNAGRGLVGAVEEASAEEVRAIFEVNVFGLLTVTRAVLPVLRKQGSGVIVNISSVGGFFASPGWGVYAATKFAVEGLSEAMRAELAPLGIAVTLAEPNAFRTDFLSGLHWAAERIDDYATTADESRVWAAENNGSQPGDPVRAAAAIVSVATRPNPPARFQLGEGAVERIETKLAFVAQELSRWRDFANLNPEALDALERESF